MTTVHPTKDLLLSTTISLLEQKGLDALTSEQVLNISGISKGSLYHHFVDFSDLVEQAQVRIFALRVDLVISVLATILQRNKTKSDFIKDLSKVLQGDSVLEIQSARITRFSAFAAALASDRMKALFAVEQSRYSEAIADVFRQTQERGWGNKNLDPLAVSVFIQSYNIGMVIDQFVAEPINPENWAYFVNLLMNRVLFSE
jgi:AcrR family transcriptional regulator